MSNFFLALQYTRTKIENGEWGRAINPDKQAPHMKATKLDGKSYFNDDVDVQSMLDKYAGTGQLKKNVSGYSNKEIVKNVKVPGSVLTKSGELLPINGITIHHSKKRTHIVPYTEGSDK